MSRLIGLRSGHGVLICSGSTQQDIFSSGKYIIGAEPVTDELLKALEESPKNLERYLLKGYSGKGARVLIGRGSSLKRLKIGQRPYKEKVERLCILNGKADMGKLPGKRSGLEDLLQYAYDHDQGYMQFGFCDRQGAKALYHPETSLSIAPFAQQKRGGSPSFEKLQESFYHALLKLLEEGRALTEDKGLFKRIACLPAQMGNEEKLKELIERFLDYSDGPVERHTTKRFLQRIGQKSVHKPKKSDLSLQKRLDHELLPKDKRSAIVRLSTTKDYSKLVQDACYSLQRELGVKVEPLINFPIITFSGDTKDIDRLYSIMDKKRYSMFGKANSQLLSGVRSLQYAHGIYIPELIGEFERPGSRLQKRRYRVGIKDQWNLDNIGSPKAKLFTKGEGIKVAVCDTGVDYSHEQLSARFGPVKGYDFVDMDNDPMDEHYHGTHVAGTVAGYSTGVAPGCSLFAVRILDAQGSGTLDSLLKAVDWCMTNKIDIANFSLGSAQASDIEYEVFQKADNMGLISVAAAGNEMYGPSYPAAYDCTIAVAAVDSENRHAYFSNIYYTNDVSAPGVAVYSSMPGQGYDAFDGTSMACPHISGSGALIRSISARTDREKLINIIEDTCLLLGEPSEPDYRATYGCGLVQADKAVEVCR